MNTMIMKWGNSLALRIPKAVVKDIHLHQGSVVELRVVGEKMEIKPQKRNTFSLSQLLQGVTKKNLHVECDWGGAVGKESF